MTVAVLAVQGAFIEHEKICKSLGAACIELRQKEDVSIPFDGLILPGGESTAQGKLLKELGMFEPLRKKIADGLPVLATCAGLILLAENVDNDKRVWFRTLPVSVRRNAYGRQLGSFHTEASFEGLGTVPMTFIRAPYIQSVTDGVEILSKVDERIVAARYNAQLALSFHPELDGDTRIHELFLHTL